MAGKRVEAVKAFAIEHYEEGGWDVVVETYSDADIYNIVKHTRSEEGAIKKVAREIGAHNAVRKDIIAEGGEQVDERLMPLYSALAKVGL